MQNDTVPPQTSPEPGEILLTVTTTSGIILDLKVAGYRQEPVIEILAPTEVQGRRIRGRVSLGTPKGAPERGVLVSRAQVFFRASAAVPEIEAAVQTLPERVYRIFLDRRTGDLDGDIVTYRKWVHERYVPHAPEQAVERMLEAAGITEIPVDEAARMWEAHTAEKRRPFLEEAQRTGKPVKISRAVVECDDPDEECSADIVTTYIRPDGTTYTTRHHTY